MSDSARSGWVQPVLLSVTTSAALGFAFLYFVRPNAGELGAIRVVVDDAKSNGRRKGFAVRRSRGNSEAGNGISKPETSALRAQPATPGR